MFVLWILAIQDILQVGENSSALRSKREQNSNLHSSSDNMPPAELVLFSTYVKHCLWQELFVSMLWVGRMNLTSD